MCGRFANDAETNELIEEFVAQGNDFRDWRPQFSIAPTEVVPIVRERRDSASGEIVRSVVPAEWDFHPPFLTAKSRPQFNARIETIAVNGLWKSAFAGTRCIVPMRGYFEWTGEKGDKQPHFLHGQRPILAAAGLATARKVDGDWVVSTAIVTREARDASGEVHDRMPAFLTRETYDEWLSPVKLESEADRDRMLGMLDAVSAEVAAHISSFEVDRRVNNSRAVDPADPGLIEPLVP
ncbi:SOS response-associated peptidase [Homoserinibacter sp. GY 40078]|uniref:SOS response-associated peptidase n=1 Tax=Homoserinibacter sp. GY 40078 TaxID=2603275 RepID=UPI0011C8761B|nr:SOS response-associated peptidase [Homoserinibacter sp. GY 40078]TXK16402.1 SOS response-associated peptidase [Homoserinibacter sp. GY 40078]